ncbi:SNX5 [Cordylochernes scorpioides]|uniref:Sorting nexin n=1 Tax=Cordylochernes scorpioides TaxID=51811 RepID=A0ABY6JWI4_9ARAC|nr:SNX5 [Cordylochernes scorpioides]
MTHRQSHTSHHDYHGFVRGESVDLGQDSSLRVDISDALSEKDKVKFTVHTKTTLSNFAKPEFSVVRLHEEFIWLHTYLEDNDNYAGYIIPPAPPRPDFDASREKLQRLGDGEGSMTKEEFNKMKQELEAEYLATFKKTVAMHEVFLQRLACHPVFRTDPNFIIFLEYDQELNVRGKNKKERLASLWSNISKSADDLLLSSTVKDVDEFFEHDRTFLVQYHNHVREATQRGDRMTRSHKSLADCYIQVSLALLQLGTLDPALEKFFAKVSDTLEKARKLEGRVASDEDLKMVDTLRYYMKDSAAAKDLLYRRIKSLHLYEEANKNLERARLKNRDVHEAEKAQQEACEKFEKISALAKQELQDFKVRRVAAYRKNLVEMAELQVKHATGQSQLFKSCLEALREEGC